jgi:hypothetical protein
MINNISTLLLNLILSSFKDGDGFSVVYCDFYIHPINYVTYSIYRIDYIGFVWIYFSK